jgi:riboflavin kinase/FMN adenylyltransferase
MAIIRRLVDRARESRAESVLITFYPHPRKVLYPDADGKDLLMISSQQEKIDLLGTTGLDHLIILEFTLSFSRISFGEFVIDYLVKDLKAVHTIIGFNHHFGYKREGGIENLTQLGVKYGFTVEEIPEQDIRNETVSSTRIRKAVKEGEIQRANAYLDHPYLITTELIMSAKDQSGLDFLKLRPCGEDKLLPPPGYYASYIIISSHEPRLKAVLLVTTEGEDPAFKIFPVNPEEKVGDGAIKIQLFKNLTKTGDFQESTSITQKFIKFTSELIY